MRFRIFTWTPGADSLGGAVELAAEAFPDAYASSDDRVVWNAYVGDNPEIFLTKLQRP